MITKEDTIADFKAVSFLGSKRMLNKEQNISPPQKFYHHASLVLLFLLVCRLIANYIIPLNDATEARYGEIARKMLETGNWVTPFHDYGVPFWAKPPLSTWLSALSMKLFGVNEFAARFPSLLLSLAVLWLIWDLAKKHSGPAVATLAVLILSGSLYFFLDAGAVMTDPSLLFCTTLSTVAFWHAFFYQNKIWSYVFFIGLGLGLLAKGPIAIVLVGIPIFFWVLCRNEWRHLWQRLPWLKGSLIVLVIALPWYLLAELRTPGFLNYFIVGEHLHRFLTPGWTGDKYGMAHDEPKGMIWIYALAGIFPWCIVAVGWAARNTKQIVALCRDEEGWTSYLFWCAAGPLFFFTFASNIIYPYVIPSLPAFALAFAEIWNRSNPERNKKQWIVQCASLCGIGFLIAIVVFELKPNWVAKTQEPLVKAWLNQHPSPHSWLVYWETTPPFSAQFYSSGQIKATRTLEGLSQWMSKAQDNYFVVNANEVSTLPKNWFARCQIIAHNTFRDTTMLLAHCSRFDNQNEG